MRMTIGETIITTWEMPRLDDLSGKDWINGCKYIRGERRMMDVIIIFPKAFAHIEIARKLGGGKNVASAGFIEIQNNEIVCIGKSESIEEETGKPCIANDADSAIIRAYASSI